MNADSTLILRPDGMAAITFSTLSLEDAATGYYAPVDYIRFHEDQREEIFYSGGPNVEGGQFISSHGPLVPVELRVFVWANSKATCITRAQVLKQAIANEQGGMLEYEPETLTIRHTFYHYVKSPVPKLADVKDNLWENHEAHNAVYGNNVFVLVFDVTLQTMPAATSDPDNLVSLTLSRSTLDNTRAGADYNYFDLDGAEIVGDLPAYVQLLLRNSQSGSNQEIGKLYLATRSTLYSVLAMFSHIYEAEDATTLAPTAIWSSVASAPRSAGDYRRCNPGAEYNDTACGLRFTISNESYHRGRCTVIAAVRAKTAFWSSQVKYTVSGNVVAESSGDNYPENFGKWSLMVCGEIDMPPLPQHPNVTISPTLEVYFTRSDGSLGDYIDVDFIMLAFANEYLSLDVDEEGISNSQKLLIGANEKNQTVAQIVNQATSVLERAVGEHYGSPALVAMPGYDARVMVLWQRVDPVVFEDDFTGYEGVTMLPLVHMKESENWEHTLQGTMALSDALYTEGDFSINQSLGAVGNNLATGSLEDTTNLDDSSIFGQDDYLCFSVYMSSIANLSNFALYLHAVSNYSQGASISTSGADFSLSNFWNQLYVLKSDFSVHSGMAWSKVDLVTLDLNATGGIAAYTDYIRVESADPDNVSVPNATGAAWDFNSPGLWTITFDGPDGEDVPVLACIRSQYEEDTLAIRDISTPDDLKAFAMVAFMDDTFDVNARGGIAFRVIDDTYGSESLYAFQTGASGIALFTEYTGGVEVDAFSKNVAMNTREWHWLGVSLSGSTFNLYLSGTDPGGNNDSEKLANLLSEKNLVGTVTDSSKASGKIGLIADGLFRCGRFYVERTGDLHLPADQVTVSAKALYRSTYPFAT